MLLFHKFQMPLSLVKYISKLLEIRLVYLTLRHALPQEVFFRFFLFFTFEAPCARIARARAPKVRVNFH